MRRLLVLLLLYFLPCGSASADEPSEPAEQPLVEPNRADRLELGGYLQVRYAEGGDQGLFRIRRARVQLEGRLKRELRFELDVDLCDLGLSDSAESARALKDVILEGRPFPGIEIRAGQFKKAFLLEEDTSSRNLPVIERGLLSDHLRDLGYAGRDVGLELHGELERGPWEAAAGVSVMNGEGDNQGRVSDGFNDFILNLALERKDLVELSAAVQWKARPDAPSVDETRAMAAALGLKLEWRRLRFEGEWLGWDIDPYHSVSLHDDRGFGLWGMASCSARIKYLGLREIEIGLRAEKLEPNKSRVRGRGDISSRWSPCLTLYPHRDSRIRIGPQIDWVQDPRYETAVLWMAEWQLAY
jgi:hypothetical protein